MIREKGSNIKFRLIIAVVLLAIAAVLFLGLWRSGKDARLNREGLLTIGRVITIKSGYKASYIVSYEFEVNGKRFADSRKVPSNSIDRSALRGQLIQVLYEQVDPRHNYPFLTNYDYLHMDREVPDSFMWIKQRGL